jgi:hypothetical protein
MNFDFAGPSANCHYLDREIWVLGLCRRKFLGELAEGGLGLSGWRTFRLTCRKVPNQPRLAIEGVTKRCYCPHPVSRSGFSKL